MMIQGVLKKIQNVFYLVAPDGRYIIHSFTDVPKIQKLEEGTVIHGDVFAYTRLALSQLGYDYQGYVYPGHLHIGVLKE